MTEQPAQSGSSGALTRGALIVGGVGGAGAVFDAVFSNRAEMAERQRPPETPAPQRARQERPTMNASIQAAQGVLDGLLDDSRFYANPLNDKWQSTYKFRLFTTNDEDFMVAAGNPADLGAALNALDTRAQVTLAESGVTAGFVIQDVNMESVVGPNSRTRNVNVTKITMTIREPLGTAFLDALAGAANDLGIRNYQRSYYLLELRFLAYDQGGQPLDNALVGSDTDITGRWIWFVRINSIDTRFDSSGSTYTLEMMPFEEQIFSDDALLRLPQFTSVSGTTVREFLDSLATAMNDGWRQRHGGEIITFKFKTHNVDHPAYRGDAGNIQIAAPNQQQNPVRGLQMEQNRRGQPTAQLPMGTAMTDIVDFLFMNTRDGQNIGLDRENREGAVDAQRGQPNARGHRESVVFRLEPEVRIAGYDPLARHYKLEFTLHVRPFYTQAPIVSEAQVEAAKNTDVQRRMVEALTQRNFLVKKFDYLFTGRNTEVLECDIRYNLAWSAVLPRLEGAQGDYAAVHVGPRAHEYTRDPQGNIRQAELSVEEQQVRQRAAQVRQEARQELDRSRDNQRETSTLRQRIAEAERRLIALGQDPDAQAGRRGGPAPPSRPGLTPRPLNALTQQERAEVTRLRRQLNEDSITLNDLDAGSSGINQRLTQLRQEVEQLDARINPPPPRRLRDQEVFLDEANGGAAIGRNADRVYAEDQIAEMVTGERRTMMPISFEQAGERTRAPILGFYGQYHRDRSVFGAVLEQLYEPFTGNFVNIELTVRGDPYFLGKGNLARQIELRTGAGESAAPRGNNRDFLTPVASFTEGHICFLLTFRYPYMIGTDATNLDGSSDEGRPMMRSHDQFNGIYQCIKIESTFSEGQFKQKLSALKLPLIDIIRAFGFTGVGEQPQPVRQPEQSQQLNDPIPDPPPPPPAPPARRGSIQRGLVGIAVDQATFGQGGTATTGAINAEAQVRPNTPDRPVETLSWRRDPDNLRNGTLTLNNRTIALQDLTDGEFAEFNRLQMAYIASGNRRFRTENYAALVSFTQSVVAARDAGGTLQLQAPPPPQPPRPGSIADQF